MNFAGTIKILYAYYGVSCANGNHVKAVQDRSTSWAARICNGKTTCRGMVHTRYLTDPYRGCAKDFIVVAQCAQGKVIANLVPREAQGKYFSLSCC